MNKLTDAQLLSILQRERTQSVGFDNDAELNKARERALDYAHGRMPDMPALEGRSRVVDSAVADAVETVLPDLIEIFLGEDVATFQPRGPQDEDQAQVETDAINHVFFDQNPGFLNLETMFKDASLTKTGLLKGWWEEGKEERVEHRGKSADELALAAQQSDQSGHQLDNLQMDGVPVIDPTQIHEMGSFDFDMVKPGQGKVCIRPVAPEDFTVARDTISLNDATYCAQRARPRAQDLLDQGIDADLVAKLPPLPHDDSEQARSRDTADESDQPSDSATANLHTVETVEHFIRVDADGDGKSELWRILTGADETVLLEKQQVKRVAFAAITPYIVTHRFYGESLADKLIEVQRIKTSLQRIALDSAYFALNTRTVVASKGSNEFTISDLLDNQPGGVVRTDDPSAVVPLIGGQLSFDAMGALEYFSTVAEQRTGVVRNAQGLNPDTLHDTAKGAMALLNAAQKRVRHMARIFAETGVKDIFLLIHHLLREHSDGDMSYPSGRDWKTVQPGQWAERDDMAIEIGVGSAGREHDLLIMTQVIQDQNMVVQMQGGLNGPLVTKENVWASRKRFCERAGLKSPERFYTDPATLPPQQPQQPPPDPKLMEVQGKLQLQQQQQTGQAQLDQAKAQRAAQLATQQAQADLEHRQQEAAVSAQITQQKHAQDLELKRQTTEVELQLKRDQMAAEIQLRREQMAAQIEMDRENAARAHEVNMAKVQSQSVGRPVEVGGEPG